MLLARHPFEHHLDISRQWAALHVAQMCGGGWLRGGGRSRYRLTLFARGRRLPVLGRFGRFRGKFGIAAPFTLPERKEV